MAWSPLVVIRSRAPSLVVSYLSVNTMVRIRIVPSPPPPSSSSSSSSPPFYPIRTRTRLLQASTRNLSSERLQTEQNTNSNSNSNDKEKESSKETETTPDDGDNRDNNIYTEQTTDADTDTDTDTDTNNDTNNDTDRHENIESSKETSTDGGDSNSITSSVDLLPPIPCPLGLSYLPFQKEAILDNLIPSSSSDGRKGILLADEMGLGKTVSVIGGINVLLQDHYGDNNNPDQSRRRFKVLIVAPKSVLSHWEHELNRWIVLPPNAVVTKDENDPGYGDGNDENNYHDIKPQIGTITAKDGIPTKDCDIYLINYEVVGKYLEEIFSLFGNNENNSNNLDNNSNNNNRKTKALDVLVCDECHYLKSVDSQRTHATLGHHKHSASQPGVAVMAERLWLVTGSPILNNPLDLFPLLNALAKPVSKEGLDNDDDSNFNSYLTLEAFPELASFVDFRDRYCGRQVTNWGVTYKGGRNLSELRNRLTKPLQSESGDSSAATPLMVRRTKQKVLPELPDKRHQLFPLDDGGIAASEEFDLLEEVLKEDPNKSNDDNDNNMASLETYLLGFKVVGLKELCKERDLPVGGRKSELIERLLRADAKGTTTIRAEYDTGGDTDDDSFAETPTATATATANAVLGEESSRFDKDDANFEAITDLRSSALSALQTAPSDNRRKIMNDLLRVPRIMSASNQNGGDMALLGALGRARHQTALRKVPYVIELLEIALLSHKVVVFAHHRDVQEIIYQAFPDQAVALNGDTPQEDRMKVVQAFQTDPQIKLFVGSIRASGLGISLTAASHVVFVEMDWSPSIVQQAEDRCHRVGQRASVLVQYIFFKGTIDEHLSQLLVEKQRTLSAAIEEPDEGSAAGWVFDFGKHSGKIISDVAAEDPGYLKWLVDDEIYIGRRANAMFTPSTASGSKNPDNATDSGVSEGLTEGLIELGFLNPQGKTFPTQSSKKEDDDRLLLSLSPSSPDPPVEDVGDFVITFGKHKGKALKEIPRSYLVWMSLAGASTGKPGLTDALRVHLTGPSSDKPRLTAPPSTNED